MIHIKYQRLLVFMLICILLLTTIFTAIAFSYPCEGTANTQDVKVRAKSNTSAKVIVKLKKGETITIVDEEEKENGDIWYQVETAKGKTGYILSDYLAVAETDRIDAAKNSDDAAVMSLTVKASCADYNGVGKNWTQYYEWNGIQVQNNKAQEVTLAPGFEFTVYSRIREQDSKPDTNMEKTVYTPTEDELRQGFTVMQTITVTENSGKKRGNKAIWNVVFTFKPIKSGTSENNTSASEKNNKATEPPVQKQDTGSTEAEYILDHYETREVQKSRQVIDHYETYYTYSDNGEGSFTEEAHERPVYKTEYYTETVQEPVYVPVKEK